MRKAAPLEADDIEPGERGAVAERHAERNEVVLDAGEAADKGVRADADELMRRRSAAHDREVADLAMAREHHVVGQDDALAETAVVGDMGVGEEHAARADDRLRSAALRARVHRHAFADQAILADDEADRLAAILEVLRLVADRGERERCACARRPSVSPARLTCETRRTPSPSVTCGPTWQKGPISTSAPSRAPSSTTALGWMRDGHSRTSIAETSASQTSAPSTFASPRNHHMLRCLAVRVMWSRTWSPGTTGLRNFALSIVIR